MGMKELFKKAIKTYVDVCEYSWASVPFFGNSHVYNARKQRELQRNLDDKKLANQNLQAALQRDFQDEQNRLREQHEIAMQERNFAQNEKLQREMAQLRLEHDLAIQQASHLLRMSEWETQIEYQHCWPLNMTPKVCIDDLTRRNYPLFVVIDDVAIPNAQGGVDLSNNYFSRFFMSSIQGNTTPTMIYSGGWKDSMKGQPGTAPLHNLHRYLEELPTMVVFPSLQNGTFSLSASLWGWGGVNMPTWQDIATFQIKEFDRIICQHVAKKELQIAEEDGLSIEDSVSEQSLLKIIEVYQQEEESRKKLAEGRSEEDVERILSRRFQNQYEIKYLGGYNKDRNELISTISGLSISIMTDAYHLLTSNQIPQTPRLCRESEICREYGIEPEFFGELFMNLLSNNQFVNTPEAQIALPYRLALLAQAFHEVGEETTCRTFLNSAFDLLKELYKNGQYSSRAELQKEAIKIIQELGGNEMDVKALPEPKLKTAEQIEAEEKRRREAEEKRRREEEIKNRKAGALLTKTANGIEYRFRYCPPGSFMMGSPKSEWDAANISWKSYDEQQHRVTLTKGFWMLETEVTQAMWESVMGSNPSSFKGAQNPVEQVSWDDCQEFCRKLSQKLGGSIKLPSEAQWEYACRAGTTTPFNFGSTLNGDKANCDGKYPYGTGTKGRYHAKTVAVKSYDPNAWGLYDMHGNVWEWCQDWYGDYPSNSVTDPTGPASGSYRVNRGGSWFINAKDCRSAFRSSYSPEYRIDVLGLRVLLEQ